MTEPRNKQRGLMRLCPYCDSWTFEDPCVVCLQLRVDELEDENARLRQVIVNAHDEVKKISEGIQV